MSRVWRVVALAALLLVAGAHPALAHQGNPNYRSNIAGVSPAIPGVTLEVLNYNSDLILTNGSHRTVTVLGYQHEPYARVLGDGTVQVNKRSPAYYLNQDFYSNASVPASASPSAAPQWVTQDKTGRFQWHDHRIHWMSTSLPPQVKDKSKTTKIFDWQVPIRVGNEPGAITGHLYWHGQSNALPGWAPISLIVFVIGACAAVAIVRRRRLAADQHEDAATASSEPAQEAW